MATQTSKFKSTADIFRGLSAGLTQSVDRPNIFGYKPHQKQELFHGAGSRNRLYIGGNRAGKTVAGICEDIWWLTGRHPFRTTPPPPVRGRIVGVDFNNGITKILKPELARWIPLSDLRGGSWESAYSKEERTLYLENGSFVEFMSYDQDLDKFAGTSRHFIHFDEEPPEDIWLECKARLIDTGGSWWMTMTPVEGMTWIYDQIYMAGKNDPTANISVVEAEMTENPYLAPGEVQEFISGLNADDRLARVKGKFVQLGGLVFKHFDPALHVIDSMIPPTDWEWYASCDHGFNAPTAWLWHAVSKDNVVITFSEHYEAERTVDYHASVVHSRNAMFGRVPDHYVGDPAIAQRQGVTGESIQLAYSQLGVPIALGNNDVDIGINKISQYLKLRADGKPNWYITKNCPNLIREMQRLRWSTYATKRMAADRNKQEKIHKKNDHAPDSARYFFTFLPDLTPSNYIDPSSGQPLPSLPIAGNTGYTVGVAGRIDELLAQAHGNKKNDQQWKLQANDEYMGNEW